MKVTQTDSHVLRTRTLMKMEDAYVMRIGMTRFTHIRIVQSILDHVMFCENSVTVRMPKIVRYALVAQVL